MKSILTLLFINLAFSSCMHPVTTADRPELNGAKDQVTVTRSESKAFPSANEDSKNKIDMSKLTDQDIKKYAYELGMNPDAGLSNAEKNQILMRFKVRTLERTLDSTKERQHYSKILPYLKTDQEKVDYLSMPTIEGRQSWVVRNKIWSRVKDDKDFTEIVEAQDLSVGMTQELVRKSWGEPESVEFSGNPIYKNEKWRYVRDVPSPNGYKRERRYVYFEGGRVVGWETE